MLKKWDRYESAIDNLNKILENDPEKCLTRVEACEEMAKMPSSVWTRDFASNCLWLAYGKPIKNGNATIYPVKELRAQLERVTDYYAGARLMVLYHDLDDDRFEEEVGRKKSEVFCKGSWLSVGGQLGVDWG